MLNMTEHPPKALELHPQGQTRIKPAADLLGVHHQTLRRWWKAGKIAKPTNIHGILLFKNADLLAFIERGHASDTGDQAQEMEG